MGADRAYGCGRADRHRDLWFADGINASVRLAADRIRSRERIGAVCRNAGRRDGPGHLSQRRIANPQGNIALDRLTRR